MQLEDCKLLNRYQGPWDKADTQLLGLDDLCVRFIINLPPEELQSVERICFQVEEAQWFYEDFIRPLDPSLPSLSLRAFSLRIFQHCPLFSQWEAHQYTTAFAEFMAYKSRVPVRGAIMLNEALDEVVLVKGWKKGANWSFPRGKINKDENDLECAIREVYEETGFDIREAGLVGQEKDMKYIEITMREQQMRLYVFRGVPRDTYFEPKTRKEISKIEWYKLTDLPTLKRNRDHDGNGNLPTPAVNANKFYMVAPFLNPLKKWITQQKKKENRYSSNLSAPPITAEETATEDEREVMHRFAPQTQPIELPGITLSGSLPTQELSADSVSQPTHVPGADTEKSHALLALLRGGKEAQLWNDPKTPMEQMPLPSEVPRSPHESHLRRHQLPMHEPTPSFEIPAEMPSTSSIPSQARPRQMPPQQQSSSRSERGFLAGFFPEASAQPAQSALPSQPTAPYHRTGDPQFARPPADEQRAPAIPPASALPTLTAHTKSLLDTFKVKEPAPPPVQQTSPASVPASQTLLSLLQRGKAEPVSVRPTVPPPRTQTMADLFKTTTTSNPNILQAPEASAPLHTSGYQAEAETPFNAQSPVSKHTGPPLDCSQEAPTSTLTTVVHRPQEGKQRTLLDLFRQPSTPRVPSTLGAETRPSLAQPAELAALPNPGPGRIAQNEHDSKPVSNTEKITVHHLHPRSKKQPARAPREGETAATINGPLSQPHFEGLAQSTQRSSINSSRSPVASHRTLFDPHQSAPVKILTRPDDKRQSVSRSPRPAKVAPVAFSPRRHGAPKEAPKPFQPQILRRPQTTESPPGASGSEKVLVHNAESVRANASLPLQSTTVARPDAAVSSNLALQGTHKEALLSLFGGSTPGTPRLSKPQSPVTGRVSPLTTNQLVSPTGDVPLSGIEPISTGSRMGSLASIGSGVGPARLTVEKRQTAAGDKQFLLGYLGRMASQEI